MNIIFVCTGNTCRSPMAEGLFKKRLPHISDITVSSRGLAASTGSPASENSVIAASELGADISGHKAAMLSLKDVEAADFIFTMTSSQAQMLKTMVPQYADKIYSVAEYSDCEDISDPYGGDIEKYRRCAADIDSAVDVIYQKIQENMQ